MLLLTIGLGGDKMISKEYHNRYLCLECDVFLSYEEAEQHFRNEHEVVILQRY